MSEQQMDKGELAFSTEKQENVGLLEDAKKNQKAGSVMKHSYRTTRMRFVFLLCAVFVMIGNYYCYDNPQALFTHFQQDDNLTSEQVVTLYSVYSYPNIVLPWISGIIIDKWGPRIVLIITTCLLIAGQIVFAVGAHLGKFPVMVIGRVIFGLGGESQFISQSTLISCWFQGGELAMALGSSTAASRLGSSLNTLLTPRIYQWLGGAANTASNSDYLAYPLYIGAGIIALTLLLAIAVSYLDATADKQEGISLKDKIEASGGHGNIRIKDIFTLNAAYYMVFLNCFFGYGAFFTINGNMNALIQTMWGLKEGCSLITNNCAEPYTVSSTEAGTIIVVVYLIAASCSPFVGAWCDKNGKRAILVLTSMIIFIIACIIMLVLPSPPTHYEYALIPLIIFAIFYSLYSSALWPCIPLEVPADKFGVAFGFVDSGQQLAIAIMIQIWGVVNGHTLDYRGGYFYSIVYVIGLIAIAVIPAVILNIIDYKTTKVLNSPMKRGQKSSLAAKRSFHN